MSEQQRQERIEEQLRQAARSFVYPPTPDLAARVQLVAQSPRRSTRLRWAALILVAFVLALLAVPDVRAAALAALRIGAVRIFRAQPTTVPMLVPTAAIATVLPTTMPRSTPTLAPTPTPSPPLAGLVGETTLDQARKQVSFPIRTPTFPADLGQPDRVYVQELGGPAVVMAWFDPTDRSRVQMAIYVLSSDIFIRKMQVETLSETQVHGQRAAWVNGPYLLQFYDPSGVRELSPRRIVEGNTLIWTEGELTYRLESTLSMDDAVRAAESLR